MKDFIDYRFVLGIIFIFMFLILTSQPQERCEYENEIIYFGNGAYKVERVYCILHKKQVDAHGNHVETRWSEEWFR